MKLFKIIGLILVLSPLGQAFGADAGAAGSGRGNYKRTRAEEENLGPRKQARQAFGQAAGAAGIVPDEHLVYLCTKISEDRVLMHLLGQFGSLASDYLSGSWYPASGINARDARQKLITFVLESRDVPGFDEVLIYALHPLINIYGTRKTPGIFYKTGRNFPIDQVLRQEIAGIMGINLDRQKRPSSLLHLAARAIPLDPSWSPNELIRRRIAAARRRPVKGGFLSGIKVNWK